MCWIRFHQLSNHLVFFVNCEYLILGYSDLSTGQILIKDKGAQNIIYGSYIKILGYLSVGNHLQPKFEDHNYEIIISHSSAAASKVDFFSFL